MLTWQAHFFHSILSHSFFTFGRPSAFPHSFGKFLFASTTRSRAAFRNSPSRHAICFISSLLTPFASHYLSVISPRLCLSSLRNCASSFHKFAFDVCGRSRGGFCRVHRFLIHVFIYTRIFLLAFFTRMCVRWNVSAGFCFSKRQLVSSYSKGSWSTFGFLLANWFWHSLHECADDLESFCGSSCNVSPTFS